MDLSKKTQELDLRKQKVDLIKSQKGLERQLASVVVCMDYSGSMDSLYRNGTVQNTFERLLPIGLSFDDNKEVDVILFHHDVLPLANTCNVNNVFTYVADNVRGEKGSTNYAPPIEHIVKKYGNKKSSGGLMSMFSKATNEALDYPVYVIYITDGANDDRSATEKAIRNAAEHGIFFQFVGIGNTSFHFLEKLDDLTGRYIDNADFFQLNDLNKIDDDTLYNRLMTEFPNWVKEARNKGLIK